MCFLHYCWETLQQEHQAIGFQVLAKAIGADGPILAGPGDAGFIGTRVPFTFLGG